MLYMLTAGAAAVALGASVALWPGTPPASPAVAEPTSAALTVTVAPAERVQWPIEFAANGVISPWQEASVGAQTAGLRLLEVGVNVGDVVKRGELLARFDDSLLRAEVTQLRASVDEARATAAQADANEQRVLLLKGSGGISEQEILQNVTRSRTARAQVDVARAMLVAKELQLGFAEVRAPDDGQISARSATLGAVSSTGQELFRLVRQRRLEWRGELTASQLSRVSPGQRVTLDLADGHTATARIRQTAPLLDAQTRLGIAYADIDPGSQARGGMYASGRIAVGASEALVVPSRSVVIRDGRSLVYRTKGEDAASRVMAQAVTTGRREGEHVEITQGLEPGAAVIVQGAGMLNDGDTVRISRRPGGAALSQGSDVNMAKVER
jgi:RND family efflux transporter MFP subunit